MLNSLQMLMLHPAHHDQLELMYVILRCRRFSHPVAVLPRAAVSIKNSDAIITSINSTGSRGDLCSDFSIRIMVSQTQSP